MNKVVISQEVKNAKEIMKQIEKCMDEEAVVKIVDDNALFDSLFSEKSDLVCVVLKECSFSCDDILRLKKAVCKSEHIAFSFYGDEEHYFNSLKDRINCEYILIDVSLLRLVWFSKKNDIIDLSIRDALYRIITESNQYGLQAYICAKEACSQHDADESSKKVLLWMEGIPNFPNGTSIHALGMLEGLYSQRDFLPQIDVCLNKETAECYDIENRYGVKVIDKNDLCEIYDVVFLTVFICSLEVLDIIDKHANKWCAWILDAIDLRCFNNTYQLNRTRFFSQFADGLVFTSNDACQDFSSFVMGFKDEQEQEVSIISIPATIRDIDNEEAEDVSPKAVIPMSDYILVVGNRYKHKMIEETIDAVSDIEDYFVVLGAAESGYIRDNVYGLVSGSLSGEELVQVYLNSAMVMFPSIYEGFGLPIMDAVNCGKCVIVVDRQLNHELEGLGDFSDRFYYYKSYEEVEKIIKEIRAKSKFDNNVYSRTWEDVGVELSDLINKVIEKKTDINKITNRHSYFDLYDKNEASRNRVLQIVASIDEEDINCDKVVDIYGRGKNSIIFAKKIRKKCSMGTIIDKNTAGINNVEGFNIISPSEYCYNESHVVVIIPEHFYSEIRKELITRDARFENIIVNLDGFLKRYSL